MLVLSRREGQSVKIGDDIEVVVLELRHGSVRLGFRCASDLKILRNEVPDHDAHQSQPPRVAEYVGAGMWDGEPD